ncbi:iron-sulfur cluster assembly accessory protein [Alicyclobacillus tolerans]|uniref:iron-sulfur cluster assembly accessory protein n=1 Tax=Alicyclobacillus tolerans TaxID=90970 RepID=UPI001F1DAA30|nr:iron-sulfur cluster assembly accessory protein [Alicyclobacillus tolerans]MCF8566622.1 iron-sulfur cluster assembly accessory protein [Alicyclobacillus tolerans]
MNCKVSASAAKKLSEILDQEDDKNLKFRVFVGHVHGNHAHYGLGLDYQKDTDELITTDTGTDVLLEKGQGFLDGVEVDYAASTDEWSIFNPVKGNHGDH